MEISKLNIKDKPISVVLPIINYPVRMKKDKKLVKDCPFYHGTITPNKIQELLVDKNANTFLLRDSSMSECLFALTITYKKGKYTSIRVEYIECKIKKCKYCIAFSTNVRCMLKLDYEIPGEAPHFIDILSLINFYSKHEIKIHGTNKIFVKLNEYVLRDSNYSVPFDSLESPRVTTV